MAVESCHTGCVFLHKRLKESRKQKQGTTSFMSSWDVRAKLRYLAFESGVVGL